MRRAGGEEIEARPQPLAGYLCSASQASGLDSLQPIGRTLSDCLRIYRGLLFTAGATSVNGEVGHYFDGHPAAQWTLVWEVSVPNPGQSAYGICKRSLPVDGGRGFCPYLKRWMSLYNDCAVGSRRCRICTQFDRVVMYVREMSCRDGHSHCWSNDSYSCRYGLLPCCMAPARWCYVSASLSMSDVTVRCPVP